MFAVIGALSMYLLRDLIIRTLFTADFYPMRELFAWQLMGDVIKIGSWVLAYIMIGRAMVRVFVITEITFSLSFFLISWWLVDVFGLKGVAMSYAVNYSLYWVTMACLAKIEIESMRTKACT